MTRTVIDRRMAVRSLDGISGRRLTLLFLVAMLSWLVQAHAQSAVQPQAVTGAANLLRFEGTDAGSGIHYVRLTVMAKQQGVDSGAPPHFTMECTELNGKRDLNWYVSFGGVRLSGFTPPFRATPGHPKPPKLESDKLSMDFEGYTRWKPMTRVWEVLPSGELHYRNPGMHSPNMESPRAFVAYLSSLPSLRIGHADVRAGDAGDMVFDTQPLLNELAKTPVCGR